MQRSFTTPSLFRITLTLCICSWFATWAYADVNWTNQPFFSIGPAILGGDFLSDNPPLSIVPLANGFRVQGALDFKATSRIVVILWQGERDFKTTHLELDIVRTSFDAAFWSNNSDTGLLGDWVDQTQATGIAAVTIGAIDFGPIPQDPTVLHPPRPQCDADGCPYLEEMDRGFDLGVGTPGDHMLLQFVELGFFVHPGDIVRIDFPVDSTIDPLPEPSNMALLGSGAVAVAAVLRRRMRS